MELGTFIIEDTEQMDLGETREAFDSYPKAKEELQAKRDTYCAFVNQLKSKKPSRITREEEKKADDLYDEIRNVEQRWLDLRASLFSKLEDLILEGKENEAALANRPKQFVEEDDVVWGKSLLAEALELRDSNDLFDALQKAYQAGECLRGLLDRAKGLWLKKHQANVDTFSAPGLL